MNTLRTVTVTRYMQPLREGGSLPALAEADDGFRYVVKFKPALRTTAVLQNIEKTPRFTRFFFATSQRHSALPPIVKNSTKNEIGS
jgi:hypothetical protein